MPTEAGIPDFADAGGRFVDGGPAPATTVRPRAIGQTLGDLVSDDNPQRCHVRGQRIPVQSIGREAGIVKPLT